MKVNYFDETGGDTTGSGKGSQVVDAVTNEWDKLDEDEKKDIGTKLGAKILGWFQKDVKSSAPVVPSKINGVDIPPKAALFIKGFTQAFNNLKETEREELLGKYGAQVTSTLQKAGLSGEVLFEARNYLFQKAVLKVELDGTPYDMILPKIINYLEIYDPKTFAKVNQEIINLYLNSGTGGGKGKGKGNDNLGGGGNDSKKTVNIRLLSTGKGTITLDRSPYDIPVGTRVTATAIPAEGWKPVWANGSNDSTAGATITKEGQIVQVKFVEEGKGSGSIGNSGISTANLTTLAAALLLLIFIPKLLSSGAPTKGRF